MENGESERYAGRGGCQNADQHGSRDAARGERGHQDESGAGEQRRRIAESAEGDEGGRAGRHHAHVLQPDQPQKETDPRTDAEFQ